MPFARNLIKILRKFKIIALDVAGGPYRGNLDILRERMMKDNLQKFIEIVEGDVRSISINDESVDLIISNELFCDLSREGLKKALEEFYRVLKPNGQMAHGELIPVPENRAQELLIEADSYSMETLTPKYEWFSPYSDEVIVLMHKIGFKNITVKYFDTNVHLFFNDALKQLKKWKISHTFIKKRIKDLEKHGLEFPMEHIIFCEK